MPFTAAVGRRRPGAAHRAYAFCGAARKQPHSEMEPSLGDSGAEQRIQAFARWGSHEHVHGVSRRGRTTARPPTFCVWPRSTAASAHAPPLLRAHIRRVESREADSTFAPSETAITTLTAASCPGCSSPSAVSAWPASSHAHSRNEPEVAPEIARPPGSMQSEYGQHRSPCAFSTVARLLR